MIETSDLFGLPLEDFVQARDEVVRRLREEGRRDEAAEAAKLRKPTTDVWALNQVARRHPERLERLTEVNQTLREADDRDAIRRASESRGRLVDQILDAAVSVLEQEGHSSAGSVRDRIARTILAAAGDPNAEQALRRGTLDRPVEISVQWPEAAVFDRPEREEENEERQANVERLEAKAQELTGRAEDLRRVAKQAREALNETRRRVEEAEKEARSAEAEARAALDEVKAARRRKR